MMGKWFHLSRLEPPWGTEFATDGKVKSNQCCDKCQQHLGRAVKLNSNRISDSFYPISSHWLLRSLAIDYSLLIVSVALSVTVKSDHEPFQRWAPVESVEFWDVSPDVTRKPVRSAGLPPWSTQMPAAPKRIRSVCWNEPQTSSAVAFHGFYMILHDLYWSVDLKNRKTIVKVFSRKALYQSTLNCWEDSARFCLTPKISKMLACTAQAPSTGSHHHVTRYAPLDPVRSTAWTQLVGSMCATEFSCGTWLHTQEMICFPLFS